MRKLLRCPTLSELPPPPPGRTGWPWTEETPALPEAMPDGRPWPRISVVTPSRNQGQFIEEALRSVLLQGYPDVESIVMDGGSNDGTVEVLRRYAPWLACWVSAPDRNATDAANQGLGRATGALVALMCSDDLYVPRAFQRFGEAHAREPEAILLGAVETFSDDGSTWINRPFNVTFDNAVHPRGASWSWLIQGLMVPRAVHLAAGPLDERVTICDDEDWLCRLTRVAPVAYVDAVVARFRRRPDTKSGVHPAVVLRDHVRAVQRYWPLRPELDPRYLRAFYHVHEAAVHLAHHPQWERFWDRSAGAGLLVRACMTCPRIVGLPLFLRLARRVLTPRRWHRSRGVPPATYGLAVDRENR